MLVCKKNRIKKMFDGKQTLENVFVEEEEDKISQKECEYSIYSRFYCEKLPSMSLVYIESKKCSKMITYEFLHEIQSCLILCSM